MTPAAQMHSLADPASSPLVTTVDLRNAGRQPSTPFRMRLKDGEELTVLRLLRVLPGKRVVGEGQIRGEQVLAKLFIARESRRHWERERSGITALMAAGLPTPPLLEAGELEGGGHYLLTAYLDEARTLADPQGGDGDMLVPAIRLVGRLHGHGLVQTDLHLGNFLRRGDELFLIDGDGIESCRNGQKIDEGTVRRNLALFLAQLPLALEERHMELIAAYRTANPAVPLDLSALEADRLRIRDRRLRAYLDKCFRDCTQFKVEKRLDRFTAVVRTEADRLAPLLADPDAWMARGTPLKTGNTSTVARVELDGRVLTIKRYNIKGPAHAASRFWRPSRAWHSWREGHRLTALGLPTPAPLALIERRLGPMRGKAWLINEFAAGPNLLEHCSPYLETALPEPDMLAILRLFRGLAAARITHGDMKASNLLWRNGAITLIDLDAVQQHRRGLAFQRAWRRDVRRFLENWPQASVLRSRLEAALSSLGSGIRPSAPGRD